MSIPILRLHVSLPDRSVVSGVFPSNATLFEIISHFERLESTRPRDARRHFTAYRGVPPPEYIGGGGDGKKAAIEMHTNMIGDMLPSLCVFVKTDKAAPTGASSKTTEIADGAAVVTATSAALNEFKSATLASFFPSHATASSAAAASGTETAAGASAMTDGDNEPALVHLELSHVYKRPVLSAEEQRQAVANLHAKLMGGGLAKNTLFPSAMQQQQQQQQGQPGGNKASISVTASRRRRPEIPTNRASKVTWISNKPNPHVSAAQSTAPAENAGASIDSNTTNTAPTQAAAPASAAAAAAPSLNAAKSVKANDNNNAAADDDDDDSDSFYEVTEADSRLLEASIKARPSRHSGLDDDELITVRVVAPAPPPTATAAAAGAETDSTGAAADWSDGGLTIEAVFRASEPVERLYAHIKAQFSAVAKFEPVAVTEADSTDAGLSAAAAARKQRKAAAKANSSSNAGGVVITEVTGDDDNDNDEEEDEEEDGPTLVSSRGSAGMDLTRNSKLLREYPFYLFKTPPFHRFAMGSQSFREAKFAKMARVQLCWLQSPVGAVGWDEVVKPGVKTG